MKNNMKKIISNIIDFIMKLPLVRKYVDRSFVLYGIIGISGVTIDFLIFSFLVKIIGLHYVISNIISVSIGLTNNFILNRKYNFRVYNRPIYRFISFYVIGIIGIAISTLLINLIVENLGLPILLTKIIVTIIVVIFQYIGNRYITFK